MDERGIRSNSFTSLTGFSCNLLVLGVTDVQSAEELHPVAFCPPFSSGSHGIAFCPSPDGLRAAEGFAAAANARAQLV